jgi:hypothetical protein
LAAGSITELVLAAGARGEQRTGGRAHHGRGVPAGARPGEQADLDAGTGGHLGHLQDLRVGQQPDAGAL